MILVQALDSIFTEDKQSDRSPVLGFTAIAVNSCFHSQNG